MCITTWDTKVKLRLNQVFVLVTCSYNRTEQQFISLYWCPANFLCSSTALMQITSWNSERCIFNGCSLFHLFTMAANKWSRRACASQPNKEFSLAGASNSKYSTCLYQQIRCGIFADTAAVWTQLKLAVKVLCDGSEVKGDMGSLGLRWWCVSCSKHKGWGRRHSTVESCCNYSGLWH